MNREMNNVCLLFENPFRMIICGSSGSGKSVLAFLLAKAQDILTSVHRIIVVYSFDQPLYRQFEQHFGDRLLMCESISDDLLNQVHAEAAGAPILLFQDDQMWNLNGKEFTALLCGKSHHLK